MLLVRNRYPLRAVLVVGLAWLVFAVQVFFGAFVCILFLPLVPFFVGFVLSSAGLLSAAHAYARAAAVTSPSAPASEQVTPLSNSGGPQPRLAA